MGNQTPSTPLPPADPLGTKDLAQYMISSRVLITDVLKQFSRENSDVHQFVKEMSNKRVKRGDNFEGCINDEGKQYGICRYYQVDANDNFNIFFGKCVLGKPVGRGIQIKGKLIPKQKQQKMIKMDYDNYEASLLQNWETSQSIGVILTKCYQKTTVFKGTLKERSPIKGQLTIKQHSILKLSYVGQFKDSLLHGKGVLTIPQKYKYDGQFYRQQKDGLGLQQDLLRQTVYVGLFEGGKRNGFGQLRYEKRGNAKLRGFWVDGIMKAGQGVYIGGDGNFLQVIGDDIQLI